MVRRIGDSIEVRVTGGLDEAPMSFLWRGRLYVVRAVLGHWRERREWWATGAARALHGEESVLSASPMVLDRESEVWRVEASAGRIFGHGVYDLSREPTVDPPPATGVWQLVRVAD